MQAIRKILLKYKAIKKIDSNAELASILDTSERRAGYVFEGKAELSATEFIVLQHYFGGQKRVELTNLSVPDGYKLTRCSEVTINGSTLDELKDMVHELSEVEAHKESDIDAALEDVAQMRGILDRYEAELKNRK